MTDAAGTTNLGDLELARAGIQAREIDSESAAGGAVLTADGSGGAAWQAAAGGGGKKYVALLAQSDEDPPVVTVLENTPGRGDRLDAAGVCLLPGHVDRGISGRQDADQDLVGAQELAIAGGRLRSG